MTGSPPCDSVSRLRSIPIQGICFLFWMLAVVMLCTGKSDHLMAQTQAASEVRAPLPTSEEAMLAPGDMVRIEVWRQPELSGEFAIAADGSIRHPLYRDVQVAGVPLTTAEERLRSFLRQFETTPQFVISPLLAVAVGGEVRQPSLYNLPPEVSIAEAVARAGGPTERGRLSRVRLLRDGRELKLDLTQPDAELAQMPIPLRRSDPDRTPPGYLARLYRAGRQCDRRGCFRGGRNHPSQQLKGIRTLFDHFPPPDRLPRAPLPAHPNPANRLPEAHPQSRLDSLDLAEVFRILRLHVRLILVVAAVTVIAAGVVLFREQEVYRASAALRFADARSALTGGFEDPTDDGGRRSDPLLSELEILQSRSIAGAVVDAEGLRLQPLSDDLDTALLRNVQVAPDAVVDSLSLTFSDDRVVARVDTQEVSAAYNEPLKVHGIGLTVAAPPEVESATLTLQPREVAIDRLLADLGASPREPTNIIDVSYVADDPMTAQRVLDRVVTLFQTANAQRAQQQSRRRREFLEMQIARTDSILEDKQLALSTFRSRERLYSARGKLETQQAALIALQMRRGELDADLRMYNSLLNSLENSKSGAMDERLGALLSVPSIATNPVLVQPYEKLSEYQTNARH